ncbi:MAG: glycosyltransferase family 39 protein, partial [Actinomycetota bacterium]|nr:glycosyltransferase family 39 protein [Actinomycetota bacterium]
MASVASGARALPRLDSLRTGVAGIVLVVGGLLLVSLYLRTRALGASLWMDEGLSIGIASQPLLDIPEVLRQDGSPPLYYMALNIWMDLFGNGPADTQAMSVAISLLAVPGGLWAGWSLFGRRAGLICAALAALNPFLTIYAQETRMYSLMVVLSLLTCAAFLHVYAFRHRAYLPVFAALLAAILYTHSWGIFVAAGTLAAAAVPLLRAKDRRPLLKDLAIGFGAAGLLYLPWVPTLLYQTAHTGAPWLNAPRLGAPIQISKALLGGGTVTVAILLAAGSGLAAVLADRT